MKIQKIFERFENHNLTRDTERERERDRECVCMCERTKEIEPIFPCLGPRNEDPEDI